MINYSTKHLSQSALYALAVTGTLIAFFFIAFFAAEPVISYGQGATSTPFTIKQIITDEYSFLVQPTDVTMAGTIAGVSGGNATGTTQFVVSTNNSNGYYVQIAFTDNAGSHAMLGDATASEALRDFGSTTEPAYNFTASTAAQFAYTVHSTTTSDTDASFLTNGSNTCNTGSTDGAGVNCWMAPLTSNFRIVDTTSAAVSGATSTITFKVNVPSGATPVPVTDTYTATATLSLYGK